MTTEALARALQRTERAIEASGVRLGLDVLLSDHAEAVTAALAAEGLVIVPLSLVEAALEAGDDIRCFGESFGFEEWHEAAAALRAALEAQP